MNSPLTVSQMLLRILAATLAGALIGLERESHGRPAGLRTTILACVASAIAMMVSESFYLDSLALGSGGNWHPDPARLSAGVLTGIGFLGAGTILRHSNVIRGVTTAASLWLVTVLGLAFGSGLFLLGAIGVGIALVTLFALPGLEKYISSDDYATLTVTLKLDSMGERELESRLRALGLKVNRVELTYDFAAEQKTIACQVRLRGPDALSLATQAIADLGRHRGVLQAKWT